MRQFIMGSDLAFATLEDRARVGCVRFSGQEMPPGTAPGVATIGFSVDPESGVATLLVQRGVAYDGPHAHLQSWFTAGQARFSSFAQLKRWIRDQLRTFFDDAEPAKLAMLANEFDLDEELSDADRLQLDRALLSPSGASEQETRS